jgi:hypothetical protein
MQTESLIELLARGAGPAPRAVAARRLVPTAALGLAASAAAALAIFGPMPAWMWTTAAPWIKLAYGALLAVSAAWLLVRLVRPAVRPAASAWAPLAVVAAMVALGGLTLFGTPADQRLAGVLGQSWRSCPWTVLALSVPALAAILWALRDLAPTRLVATGAAAGLLAGALGAMGYALYCPEHTAAFIAIWYTLGIGLAAMLGAALGPRVLRW